MAIFRSRDKWRAVVYYEGRRVAMKGGFAKKGEAKDWHDEEVAKIKANGGQAPNPKARFEQLLQSFYAWHYPNVRHNTQQSYRIDIEQRIEPAFRYYRLEAITPAMLEDFKASLLKSDLKPKSINNCLNTTRLLLNLAVKWRYLRASPFTLSMLRIPKTSYPWWSEREHVARFLDEAKKSRYYGVYLLALETGMRFGEIAGLSKADIDFERGIIHVHRQWLHAQKAYGPTKHGRPRWVSFDPDGELAAVLKQCCSISKHEEAVFTTRHGRRPAKGGLTVRYFHGIQKRADVPRLVFHGLRHTYASWFMRLDGNVWSLMAILGHANIKTTMRYAHHSEAERRPVINLAQSIAHGSLLDSSHTSSNAAKLKK